MTDERLEIANQTDIDTTKELINVAELLDNEQAYGVAKVLDDFEWYDSNAFIYLYYCAHHDETIYKVDALVPLGAVDNAWRVTGFDVVYDNYTESAVTIQNCKTDEVRTLTVDDFGRDTEWLFTCEAYARVLNERWERK